MPNSTKSGGGLQPIFLDIVEEANMRAALAGEEDLSNELYSRLFAYACANGIMTYEGAKIGDPYLRVVEMLPKFAELSGIKKEQGVIENVTKKQALEALDSMDDFARMHASVDATGPRETLRKFIEESTSQESGILTKEEMNRLRGSSAKIKDAFYDAAATARDEALWIGAVCDRLLRDNDRLRAENNRLSAELDRK